MKTIGLIGGTGWISTAEYYRIINEETNRRRGGLNFARCILYSLDYGDIDALNRKDDRDGTYSLIYQSAKQIISSGAECIVICANTLHQFADDLEKEFSVPIIHIAKATAGEIQKEGLSKVGLLGTKQTMEMDFYRNYLEEENIGMVVPELKDRDFIQYTISNELLKGLFLKESKARFLEIIQKLRSSGVQGIVLGCTEIPLLIKKEDVSMPLFNTLTIHALAAVDFALSDQV